MKKHLAFQLNNAFVSSGFIRVSLFMVTFAIVSFALKCFSVFDSFIVKVPSAYAQFFFNGINFEYVYVFLIILPFVVCSAFSDSYVTDSKSNYIAISITRGNSKTYFFSKLIAVYICGVFVTFLPQIINYLLCLIVFPLESTNLYTWDLWQADFFISGFNEHFFFKDLYLLSPYVYFLVYILISSLMMGFVAVTAYQASFIIKNKIFVISIMFIAMNLSFRLLDAKSITYDLNEYIIGNYTGGQVLSHMLIVFAFYIILSLVLTPVSLKRLRNCL